MKRPGREEREKTGRSKYKAKAKKDLTARKKQRSRGSGGKASSLDY